ncbi:MAG: DUF6089 family protein [Saprospiraceae bacterium]|nr:DUF6089 family protein [Saprospiraceae bacterium]
MKHVPFFICVLFLCSVHLLQAQYHHEWSVFLGVANYQGDLPEPHLELVESRLAGGLIYRWHAHPKWALRSQIIAGRISGDDLHAKSRNSRKFRFSTPLVETGVMLEWKPFGRRSQYFVGRYRPCLSPYLFAGVGVTYARPRPECYRDGMPPEFDPFFREMKQSWFLALPIGLGLRADLHPDLSIGLEVGQRPVFSDLLDGVSVSGNPERDDWYVISGLTLSWMIGTRQYRDINRQ